MQRLIKTPNTIEQSEINQAKRLLDTNPVMLYHGNQDVAMTPVFGQGKSNNDYGQGFYTTPDKELGKEWAYSGFTKGECGYLHSNYLDKYFSYADSFVRMELYRESLDKALRLGNLGLQVFFKSEKAFERLHEAAHDCEIVDKKYKNFYLKRDQDAREQFLAIRREDRLRNLQKGHTILDVLAENKEVGK